MHPFSLYFCMKIKGMSKECCSVETDSHKKNQSHSCSCCSDEQMNEEHNHEHSHDESNKTIFQLFLPAIISFVLLMVGIALDNWIPQTWFNGWIRIALYILAYIPVGIPVLKEAVESIRDGDFFSEFFLMSIATIGAFAIGEYPEGVAVMLFYAVGEVFQTLAVQRAKGNIKELLDSRPNEITILEDKKPRKITAEKSDHQNEKTFSFEKVEVVKGSSEMGYTAITPVKTLPADAEIVVKNAFFVNATLSNSGEHEH